MHTAFGKDNYPTVDSKAAALLHSIARNHALVDGNVAAGKLDVADDIAAILRYGTEPRG